MSLEIQIGIAVLLDALLGDPRWVPHPVKGIGRLALFLENTMRRSFQNKQFAGAITVGLVLLITGGIGYGILLTAQWFHPVAGEVAAVGLIYFSLATRDLNKHSRDIYTALKKGEIEEARRNTARIVGRDTERLDEPELARATVESVAENTVDGVTAPLLVAFIGGPVGAILYKAVNTMDSMFGYKNEVYRDFGLVAAKLDDVVNYIPARVTAWFFPVASLLSGRSAGNSLRVLQQDGRKHPSPNAGLTEAAMAGALGIELGGASYYKGILSDKPKIGVATTPLEAKHILQANQIMWMVLLLIYSFCAALKVALFPFFG